MTDGLTATDWFQDFKYCGLDMAPLSGRGSVLLIGELETELLLTHIA